eukprot:COSAG06_NODE_25012_length_647_cov_1.312044_1_plen_143_part_01
MSWYVLSSATSNADANVAANVSMSLEMDGFMEAEIALSADKSLSVEDIQLSVGIAAVQQMGMECRGSRLTGAGAIDSPGFMNCSVPRTWRWSSKPTSQLWAGSGEAGLRLFLKASSDDRLLEKDGPNSWFEWGAQRPLEWGAA